MFGAKEYVDLVATGIVDPAKVVRTALENAVLVAGVLLLTEATMTEIPEAKRERLPEPEMANALRPCCMCCAAFRRRSQSTSALSCRLLRGLY